MSLMCANSTSGPNLVHVVKNALQNFLFSLLLLSQCFMCVLSRYCVQCTQLPTVISCVATGISFSGSPYSSLLRKRHNDKNAIVVYFQYVLRIFRDSMPLAHIEERWANAALQLALSCSSRHCAGRSFQVRINTVTLPPYSPPPPTHTGPAGLHSGREQSLAHIEG